MEAFSEYLIKSAAWITGFALVYLLFLRNERFFSLKRIYLLSGILISLIFPLISVHYQVAVPAPSTESLSFQGTEFSSVTANPSVSTVSGLNYKMILLVLYITGVLFLGYRIIRHLIWIKKTISKADINNIGPARLVRISSFPASFSFFNYVFINPSVDEAEVREIMNHELVHVNQKHWLDLFLVEMLRLLQWINPFVWIYTGFVRLNNEYLADELALQRSSNPANYKAALLNQLFRSPVISLTNSFNYSLNKKRFDMMKKIITSPYRKLKVLLVLPVFAIILYAFATPEYNYIPATENTIDTLIVYQSSPITQKEVKGIVLNKDGKPLQGTHISSTGTMGNAMMAETGQDGRFTIQNVQPDATLIFFCRGYKGLRLKPDFTAEMKIVLEPDPEYKATPQTESQQEREEPLVVLDGVITDKNLNDTRKELGYNFGQFKYLRGDEAHVKYLEKGINGVYEVTTRKKAFEMGIRTPFPRLTPDDYPTFQGKSYTEFSSWIIDQAKYPVEAISQNIGGYVTINFTIELDGSLSNISSLPNANLLLASEIVKVIKSSPKWDPPKNPAVDEPYVSDVVIHFSPPDQIELWQEPFVVVEEMPMYPGGDTELLTFIAKNTQYPEEAKAKRIEGRVIARFFVSTEGTAEAVTVLKGVHPLLDAEAIRVVSMLKGFTPGKQNGKAVNVWYMVPITFTLNKTETPQ
ncbi:MAG: TonB family protein [Bacteroidota bacterium]